MMAKKKTKIPKARKNYHKQPKPGTPLTPMEKKVLRLHAKGCSKTESAPSLGMSAHGVDWHTRQIALKLRAVSTTHAVFKAFKLGWLK